MKIEEGKWKSLTVKKKKKKKNTTKNKTNKKNKTKQNKTKQKTKKNKTKQNKKKPYKVSDDSRHYEGVPRRRFIYLFIIHLLMCFLIYLF